MKCSLLLLIGSLSVLAICTLDAQALRAQEKDIRESVNLPATMTHSEVVTFELLKKREFAINSSQYLSTHEGFTSIKLTIQVYWKNGPVYSPAKYEEGEGVRLLLYRAGGKLLEDRLFYTTHGYIIEHSIEASPDKQELS